MWISEDGRAISNAWGDPSAALPDSAIKLIDSLGAGERVRLSESLTVLFHEAIEQFDAFAASTTRQTEAEFEGEWMPPEAIAHFRARTVDELLTELMALDLRWRFDAVNVVEMYLDE